MLNYDQMYNELEKTQDLLIREVRKINEKNDLTPGELNSLKDAVCVMKEIVDIDGKIEGMWNGDYEDDGYSERRMSMRGGSYTNEGSYARGRSPRTGRYVSRDNYNMRGMSRHSLNDRMAATLESMMDNAGSDFERQKIGEWIDRIKNAPENG